NHALRMIATDVSTRYRDRVSSLDKICGYIKQTLEKKKGHYMIFFPSYKYMQDTYEHFLERQGTGVEYLADEVKNEYQVKHMKMGDFTLYKQDMSMSEEEREAFLKHFEEEGVSTLNFCVLGGIFSEGIDLTGEKLIGVMIVGVGLPQIGLERDLIKGYFDEVGKEGYHYAYTYPGINKVLQAIGRLIRTEEDRGTVLLIDDRYRMPFYQNLLPHAYEWVKNPNEMQTKLINFW
ncbi:MAG: ATP-dependent DNA helicase, partial [Candidatus Cellulosilyticum pullistercoris]|nr:ATP-dependent DNA helicase [Candidatus Cellulosilyticum pullistercoris]